jgi:hypothetical protein
MEPSSSPPAITEPAAAGSGEPLAHRRLVFGIVAIALLMASIDQTIVATALNAIRGDLKAELTWSGWTITVYALGQIIVMPLAGRLGDQFGRKKIFLGAAALFTVASLCCSLADNIYLLVVFRAFQAIGGGAFMPTATGIVAEQFGRDRDRAIGMFTSIFPIGGIIGPIIGGIIVTYWSWREIFVVNIPIGLLLIVLGLRFIPSSVPKATSRIDGTGAFLLAVTMLFGMYGISSLGSAGAEPTDPLFIVSMLIALVLGFLFVRHANRYATPFIPISLPHAVRLAGDGGGHHRHRHGPVHPRLQQRQPATRPRPDLRDRRPPRHVPSVRRNRRRLRHHRDPQPRHRRRHHPGPQLRGLRRHPPPDDPHHLPGPRPPRHLVKSRISRVSSSG